MRSALVLLVLAASACAPMQWTKPGVTSTQRDQDELLCRQDAWREANLGAWPPGPVAPIVARDAAGRAFVVSPGGPVADPFRDPSMEQGRLQQFCMRAKGYELVPAEPRKKP